jgi:hypothetical protein
MFDKTVAYAKIPAMAVGCEKGHLFFNGDPGAQNGRFCPEKVSLGTHCTSCGVLNPATQIDAAGNPYHRCNDHHMAGQVIEEWSWCNQALQKVPLSQVQFVIPVL